MTDWLVEPANSVEFKFGSLQVIAPAIGRIVKRDASQSTNKPLVISDNPLPNEWLLRGTEISDFENQLRKADYMAMCGLDLLCILGSKQRAMYGAVERIDPEEDVERINLMPWQIRFVGKGTIFGYMREAEDATLGTGAVIASDTDASNSSKVELNAQNEDVYFSITQSLWALPLTDYWMYIRAKDSAQVATDCTMTVRNTSDSADVATVNKTLTASYAWYSLDFTLDSGESGDAIKFQVKKNTATTNTISVDLIAVVGV